MNGVTVHRDRCQRERRQEEVRVEMGERNETGIKRVRSAIWQALGEVRYEGSMAR
jgi:hypothetical protein